MRIPNYTIQSFNLRQQDPQAVCV